MKKPVSYESAHSTNSDKNIRFLTNPIVIFVGNGLVNAIHSDYKWLIEICAKNMKIARFLVIFAGRDHSV